MKDKKNCNNFNKRWDKKIKSKLLGKKINLTWKYKKKTNKKLKDRANKKNIIDDNIKIISWKKSLGAITVFSYFKKY